MGIRFYCPACEKKINVKDHQAGLRGICPQCGTGVDIPLESEPRRTGKQKGDARPSLIPNIAPGAAGEATVQALLPQVGKLLAVLPNAPVDPITEAPQQQWYVVPQGGTEPFGPADGSLLRQWMQEGRVGAKSMVWRQDWKDWRKAGTIWSDLVLAEPEAAPQSKLHRLSSAAPQFGSPAVPPMLPEAAARHLIPASQTAPTPQRPATFSTPARVESPDSRRPAPPAAAGFDNPGGELYYPRRTNGLYLTMVVLLVVAVIALGFITLRIFDQMRQEKTPATPTPAATPDDGTEPAPTSYRYETDHYETGTTLRNTT